MKKSILPILAAMATLALSAQEQEVLKITMADGTQTTIAVSEIRDMTFAMEEIAPEPTMAEIYAGIYAGTQKITVGGTYTYSTDATYTLKAEDDGTITVEIPQYSLTGTMMGDLTLGALTIKGLEYDEAKGGFYLDYSSAGLTQHFLAVNESNIVFDNDYVLGEGSTILITITDKTIHIENPFKLGAMPLPMTSEFEGTK